MSFFGTHACFLLGKCLGMVLLGHKSGVDFVATRGHYPTVCKRACTIFHSVQPCTRVQVGPCDHQLWGFSFFFIGASLVDEKQSYVVLSLLTKKIISTFPYAYRLFRDPGL